MGVAIVTGSAGLVGSEAASFFAEKGLDVVGIDNDMRSYFFGSDASTLWNRRRLEQTVPRYRHEAIDIRDTDAIMSIFKKYGKSIVLVIHAAAQPSHDWAAREALTDFTINANGTLNLLEATRQFSSNAVFIFTSTNKVYGDNPNFLPLVEHETRWEIQADHPYANGIKEDMSIDQTMHSLFGASKVAADILVQEYGRYFGIPSACFRAGCLTGPHHSGAQLHGFLAYLMRCAITGMPYTIFGYKGKQVRDNIHSADLIRAFDAFFRSPKIAEVYNIGGGRFSNCSLLEAIDLCQQITGRELSYRYDDNHRKGDHIWWISSNEKFKQHYPEWDVVYDVPMILREIAEQNYDRWVRP